MNAKTHMIDQKLRHKKECCLGSDCVEITRLNEKELILIGVAFGLVVAVLVVAFYSVV